MKGSFGRLVRKRTNARSFLGRSILEPCTRFSHGCWSLRSFASDQEISTGADAEDLSHPGAFTTDEHDEKIYRRSRSEVSRVFQWGVGNKYRSSSQNRIMPVHKPHPKRILVRTDYYDSDVKNVFFEDLNEQWEVVWYQDYKWHAKPFPVKKFGLEASKKEAFAFWDTVKHLQEPWRDSEDTRLQIPSRSAFREFVSEQSAQKFVPALPSFGKFNDGRASLPGTVSSASPGFHSGSSSHKPSLPFEPEEFDYSSVPASVTRSNGPQDNEHSLPKKLTWKQRRVEALKASAEAFKESAGSVHDMANHNLKDTHRENISSASTHTAKTSIAAGEHGKKFTAVSSIHELEHSTGRGSELRQSSSSELKLSPWIYDDDSPPLQFDHRTQSWTVMYYDERGRPKTKCYSARKWGNQVARDKAFRVYYEHNAHIM